MVRRRGTIANVARYGSSSSSSSRISHPQHRTETNQLSVASFTHLQVPSRDVMAATNALRVLDRHRHRRGRRPVYMNQRT